LSEAEYSAKFTGLFCDVLELPLRPVFEVSIPDLTEDTDYELHSDPISGIMSIEFLTGIPTDPVITFKAGFPDPEAEETHAAPADIKQALCSLIDHWYKNRAAYQEGTLTTVPGSYDAAVRSYRLA
jgi:hypothetical protein